MMISVVHSRFLFLEFFTKRWFFFLGLACLLVPVRAGSYRLETPPPPAGLIISEFMAENASGIKDDDGDRSDWIELLNLGSDVVNLAGWSLTDDPNRLAKWRFPFWTLAPNSYLLV